MENIDTRDGEYYVSVVDGARYALLLGPFVNDHAAALSRVEAVKKFAQSIDPRAIFYAFGTCRLPGDDTVPIRAGKFNAEFGFPARRP